MFREVHIKDEKDASTYEELSIIDNNLIERSIKECDLIRSKLSKLVDYKNNKNFEDLFISARRLISSSQKLVQMIREIPINYGDKDGYHHLKAELSGNIKCDVTAINFEYNNEVLHIVLKELLPRRLQNGKIYENLDYIRCSYLASFENYFSEKEIFFNERVVILYKHFFNSESHLIDDDNFDYKIITDLIAQYCLIDDNPKRCMKIFDYGLSDTRHTEIFVMPISKSLHYIDLPFI